MSFAAGLLVLDNQIIGMLTPGIEVALSGPRVEVASSTWAEIVTPAGARWVNGRFLAAVVSDESFRTDDRVISLLDRLSRVLDAEGDLTEFASVRGLCVSHHGTPIRFSPAQLEGILTDPTTYKWLSNAINMDDPEAVDQEVPARSFAEAIAASFVSTWDDTDRRTAFDEPLTGGNERLASDAIPPELAGVHYISVFDPGDHPEFAGLDWTAGMCRSTTKTANRSSSA